MEYQKLSLAEKEELRLYHKGERDKRVCDRIKAGDQKIETDNTYINNMHILP